MCINVYVSFLQYIFYQYHALVENPHLRRGRGEGRVDIAAVE